VLTQVAITGGAPVPNRAYLSASVETLLLDRPNANNEIQSTESDPMLAVFAPNEHPIKELCLVFTSVNICYLHATGAPLTVSGYIEKSALNLHKFAPEA
jgi:hypothetical protein